MKCLCVRFDFIFVIKFCSAILAVKGNQIKANNAKNIYINRERDDKTSTQHRKWNFHFIYIYCFLGWFYCTTNSHTERITIYTKWTSDSLVWKLSNSRNHIEVLLVKMLRRFIYIDILLLDCETMRKFVFNR